jgi:hypothetical protein
LHFVGADTNGEHLQPALHGDKEMGGLREAFDLCWRAQTHKRGTLTACIARGNAGREGGLNVVGRDTNHRYLLAALRLKKEDVGGGRRIKIVGRDTSGGRLLAALREKREEVGGGGGV